MDKPKFFINKNPLEEVKNIIAIGSGKGGVGKTTVSVNLALTLKNKGFKVGLMDADVYGPNVPVMIGLSGTPNITEDKKIIPLEKDGIKIISVHFFVQEDQPLIWRGPLVSNLINQFINDVEWGELDYLIVDLPPGTGDVQISLSQKLKLTGGIVVTTPQKISQYDVKKSVNMFKAVNVPVLGVIENMSYVVCPKCGEKIYLFPQGGGKNISKLFNIDFLGSLPFDPQVSSHSDEGKPIVLVSPDNEISKTYENIVEKIIEKTSN